MNEMTILLTPRVQLANCPTIRYPTLRIDMTSLLINFKFDRTETRALLLGRMKNMCTTTKQKSAATCLQPCRCVMMPHTFSKQDEV